MRKEDNLDRMEEIIDFVSNRLSDDAGMLGPSTTPADPVRVSEDQPTACTSKPMETSCSADPKSNSVSKRNEEKALTDLIINCVAAFLMIQVIEYTLHRFSVAANFS